MEAVRGEQVPEDQNAFSLAHVAPSSLVCYHIQSFNNSDPGRMSHLVCGESKGATEEAMSVTAEARHVVKNADVGLMRKVCQVMERHRCA